MSALETYRMWADAANHWETDIVSLANAAIAELQQQVDELKFILGNIDEQRVHAISSMDNLASKLTEAEDEVARLRCENTELLEALEVDGYDDSIRQEVARLTWMLEYQWKWGEEWADELGWTHITFDEWLADLARRYEEREG